MLDPYQLVTASLDLVPLDVPGHVMVRGTASLPAAISARLSKSGHQQQQEATPPSAGDDVAAANEAAKGAAEERGTEDTTVKLRDALVTGRPEVKPSSATEASMQLLSEEGDPSLGASNELLTVGAIQEIHPESIPEGRNGACETSTVLNVVDDGGSDAQDPDPDPSLILEDVADVVRVSTGVEVPSPIVSVKGPPGTDSSGKRPEKRSSKSIRRPESAARSTPANPSSAATTASKTASSPVPSTPPPSVADELDVKLSVKDGGMSLLLALAPECEWQGGSAEVDVRLHGSYSEPQVGSGGGSWCEERTLEVCSRGVSLCWSLWEVFMRPLWKG